MNDREAVDALSKKLADDGNLIEVGWMILRQRVIPRGASPETIALMRLVYMAGADHLFSSIMCLLDPGDEASDADLRRFDLIAAELARIRPDLERRFGIARGSA